MTEISSGATPQVTVANASYDLTSQHARYIYIWHLAHAPLKRPYVTVDKKTTISQLKQYLFIKKTHDVASFLKTSK